MAYKPKPCAKCGIIHTKRGLFCSRSCGNSRAMPDYQKATMSKVKTEWMQNTDEGEVARWRINNHDEPEPIAPMKAIDLGAGKFVEDGDLWSEV
jgi:hypothetical protein